MKRIFLFTLCAAALAFAGCSDDDTTINYGNDAATSGDGGGGGGTTDPGPGPANQVDAQIGGDGGTVELDGESESTAEGSYDAYIFEGSLNIVLSTSDATIITTVLEPGDGVIPGSTSITGAGPDGSFVNITGAAGIFNSTGGSVTIDQCPTAGGVFTGSWNVQLEDAMGGGSGQTLTGDFRATVRIDDGSITCRVVETPDAGTDAGTTDAGGGTCDNETCDGPCCDSLPAVTSCTDDCNSGASNPMSPDFDPMDPSGCFSCLAACQQIFLDDADCSGPIQALAACESDAGCDEIEDDAAYEACVDGACCDESRAAF